MLGAIIVTAFSLIIWGVHIEDRLGNLSERLQYIDTHGTQRFALVEERQNVVIQEIAKLHTTDDRNEQAIAKNTELLNKLTAQVNELATKVNEAMTQHRELLDMLRRHMG
jgi:hypothetical protein